ncbi:MAG: hypothetical protein ACOX5G_02770 [Kiritimatiellia bacterium]|jgi:hypothetical protein
MDDSLIFTMVVMGVFYFIIAPLWGALKARNKEKKERKNAPPTPDNCRFSALEDAGNPDSDIRKWWASNHSAFVTVEGQNGIAHFYRMDNVVPEIRAAILAGNHTPDSRACVHSKGENGKWSETAKEPLSKLIDSTFKLRVLYRPVWAHAMAGLKWGVLVGIGLKLADTALMLASVEPGAALCFAIAVAAVFIPRIGIIGVLVLAFVLGQFYEANFFLIGLSSALTGAILGSLPGMALGGFIGLGRHKAIERAPGASPEDSTIAFKAAVLPLLGSVVVTLLYFFVVNPWLLSAVEE